jgi:Fic family protein
MRTFEQTHPWINFRVDLTDANYRLWMLFGEAQSKCQHIAGAPLLPEVAERLHTIFLAKGVLATTAIEGNTLSEEQVLKHLQGDLHLPPSKEYLQQEVANIISAHNLIVQGVIGCTPAALRVEDILDYNRLVLHELPPGEDVVPGEYRTHSVVVGGYRGAPAEDCEYLLHRLCEWVNTEFSQPAGYEIAFGILKAIIAHVYVAWIHPYGDGNGRTARLIELQILLAAGVPALSAHLLSNHYNETRTEYYRQLERASQSGGDILPFIHYALQGFVDGLTEQIEVIREQQMRVHWINHIYDLFRDDESPAGLRKRRLILDLSERAEPVPVSEMRYVSPRIAEAYANKSDKTIQRDLSELEALDLLVREKGGIRPRREKMSAFLSPVRS